jgi:hypothetical protein
MQGYRNKIKIETVEGQMRKTGSVHVNVTLRYFM